MTATVLPGEIVEMLKPEYVAPFAAFFVSKANEHSGVVFEAGLTH